MNVKAITIDTGFDLSLLGDEDSSNRREFLLSVAKLAGYSGYDVSDEGTYEVIFNTLPTGEYDRTELNGRIDWIQEGVEELYAQFRSRGCR